MFVRSSIAVVLFLCVMVHAGVPHTDVAESTLIQVHTIFRHGARAPVVSFPNDPNHSEQNWENGFGQLTQEGLNQHFDLGQFFRYRYGDFLSTKWRYDEVKVQSSDQDRCLNSAAANLAGLYYDSLLSNETLMFKRGLPWSPVPIPTIPRNMDYLIDTDRSCKKHKKLMNEMENEEDVQKYFDYMKPMLEELEEKLDTTINNLTEAGMIYDNFNIQRHNNMSIPDYVKPMMSKLEKLEQLSYELIGKTDELKRLRSGPIISKILEDFQAKVESPPTSPKLFLYSGHDSTVAANLKALGWYNGIKPPFASAVIYELHQKDRQNYVRVFYQNDTSFSSQLHEISFPDCFNHCTLRRFRMMMTHLLPDDIHSECNPKEDSWEGFLNIVMYCFSFAFLLLAYHLLKDHLQKKRQLKETQVLTTSVTVQNKTQPKKPQVSSSQATEKNSGSKEQKSERKLDTVVVFYPIQPEEKAKMGGTKKSNCPGEEATTSSTKPTMKKYIVEQ